MSWDERLFGRIYRLLQQRATPPVGLPLEPRRGELTVLAAAVAERAVTLTTARGGESTLWVPEALDAPDDAWVYRVVHQATAMRMGLSLPSMPPAAEVLASFLAAPLIQRALFADLPGAEGLFEELSKPLLARRPTSVGVAASALKAVVQRDIDAFPRSAEELHQELARLRSGEVDEVPHFELFGLLPTGSPHTPVVRMASGSEGASGTERKARNVTAKRRIDLEEQKQGENPLVHSFEKVHTAEEYKGGSKRADATDEMGEHGDALDDLSIEEVVRSNTRARSVYRADLEIESRGVEGDDGAAPPGIPYDEWDEGRRAYRRGWCSVFERVGEPIDAAEAALQVRALIARRRREIRAIEGELARIDRLRVFRPRQPDGPEVDIEAIVDRHAALAASATPPDKLYVARRRRPPDVDVLLLLDASLSSDAWVQNRRVIDVARQSVVLLGAALHDARVHSMVASFYSNTRRDCSFVIAKRFDDSWLLASRRLLSLEPTGYTRVGPALRHGTAKLLERVARRRVLLLISDAKPTDTDQYEGRYGISDIRQAVREARAEGVDVLALAIDSTTRVDLAQMFGPGRHALLRKPDDLPIALGRVFSELSL